VRMVALAGLLVFVCFSVIFGVFVMIRSVMLILPSSLTQFRIVTDVLRVILALALAYAWFRLWKVITDRYFWRSVGAITRGRDKP